MKERQAQLLLLGLCICGASYVLLHGRATTTSIPLDDSNNLGSPEWPAPGGWLFLDDAFDSIYLVALSVVLFSATSATLSTRMAPTGCPDSFCAVE